MQTTARPRATDPNQELLVTDRQLPAVKKILGERVRAEQPVAPAVGLTRVILRDGENVTEALDSLKVDLKDRYQWSPVAGRNAEVVLQVYGQPQDSVSSDPATPVPALKPRSDSTVGAGVTIGVVDSRGWAHSWLYGAVASDPSDTIFRAADLDLDRDERLDGQVAHATFVAGLLLREAPGATVRIDHGLDNAGQGSTSGVVAAAVRLARQKVDVLNLSLGCYTDDGRPPMGFQQMLREIHPDIVVVAAAGNLHSVNGKANEFSPPRPFFPAALDDVVAVGAVEWSARDEAWRPAPFSNHGPWLDFAAPGKDLHSTFVDYTPQNPTPRQPAFRGWARWSGTSFATAVVSGTIAATMTEREVSARDAVAYLRQQETPRPRVTFGDVSVPVLEQTPWPDDV